MKRMVLGFAFDRANDQVLLIRKNRPDWQAGRLNGIGGHMEGQDGGSTRSAVRREFAEETAIQTTLDQWRHCGIIQRFGKDLTDKDEWTVSVYCTDLTGEQIDAVKKTTDETPEWVDIGDLEALSSMAVCIENIAVLVSLCLLKPAPPSNSIPRFTLEY